MLIEALIGILIFSLGILAVVKLQATSVQQASSAEYRSMASLMANDLISQMWVSNRTATTLQTNFGSPSGTSFLAWRARVYSSGLPNASTTPPTVTFTTVAGGAGGAASSQATITIFWQAPGDKSQHNYTVVAQLK